MSVKGKIYLAILVPLICTLISVVVSKNQVERFEETSDWVVHTHRVISEITYLKSLIVDMETGQRGYVITGKERFLEPYVKAQKEWKTKIDELKKRVSDNPKQVRRLEGIEKVLTIWFKEAGEKEINARRSGDFALAKELISAETGKNLIDDLRLRIKIFLSEEQGLLVNRAKEESMISSRTINIFLGFGAFSILMCLGAGFYLARSISNGLDKLKTGTTEISSSGSLSTINHQRSDEFGDLANAFNKMAEIITEKNTYLDLALEGAGLGIWDWNLLDDSVAFDKRWAEMLGLDVNEIKMELSTWKDRVHPDDLDDCYADIKRYMDGETDRYENIHRMKHVDGHWVYILDRGRFSDWDDNGKPIRFTGTHLDVTETKKAQEKELSQINSILSSTPSCLKVITRDGKLLEMNKQGLDLIEADNMESVFKANVYDIVEESHREKFIEFNERICDGSNDTLIFEIVGLQGTKRWMETYAAPYTLPNGERAHIAITNDISKKVQDEHEYQKQKAVAQHQAKLASIGELAAGVGHEINNPLAIIKGYLYTIDKKARKDLAISYEDLEKYIERIDVASERIAKIVQGLRTFSRSDSVDVTEFDPIDAVKESYDMVKEIYQNDGINLSLTETGLNVNLLLRGNRGKLQQVLMNLLANAKDAVSSKENKEISIDLKLDEKRLIVVIEDNGSGIPKGIQDKIFDPFFTTKDVNMGTGIGLSLAHNFMKDMRGELRVESEEGVGTKLFIEVPIQVSNLEDVSKNLENKKDEKNDIRFDCKVILAEDEAPIRSILSSIFEDLGMQVIEAENGSIAYKKFLENPDSIDLIVSDIKMPEMDGTELLKKIRHDKDLKTQPKFVFVTGGINTNFEDSENELNQLIDGHFYKPFDEKTVIDVIKTVLNEKTRAA